MILLLQTILLGFLALFQMNLSNSIMLFCLGLLAGYELTVFRKFRGTTVNNGIMTGNTKNMMTNLYKTLFDDNKQARRDFFHFLIIIFIFLLGAGAGALVIKLNALLNLWIAFLLMFVSLVVNLLTQLSVITVRDRFR